MTAGVRRIAGAVGTVKPITMRRLQFVTLLLLLGAASPLRTAPKPFSRRRVIETGAWSAAAVLVLPPQLAAFAETAVLSEAAGAPAKSPESATGAPAPSLESMRSAPPSAPAVGSSPAKTKATAVAKPKAGAKPQAATKLKSAVKPMPTPAAKSKSTPTPGGKAKTAGGSAMSQSMAEKKQTEKKLELEPRAGMGNVSDVVANDKAREARAPRTADHSVGRAIRAMCMVDPWRSGLLRQVLVRRVENVLVETVVDPQTLTEVRPRK